MDFICSFKEVRKGTPIGAPPITRKDYSIGYFLLLHFKSNYGQACIERGYTCLF